MNRVKSREYLLQLAYQMEITSETALETFNSFMENEDISKDDLDLAYIKSGLLGIEENKEKLDSLIESQLVKWKLNRISKVNLSILRIDLDLAYIKSGLLGIEENKEKLDSLIESQLVKWKLNRISKVNLSILRISTYEILFAEDVPGKVSINEAIELCKKYSDNKSVSFINGVLDKVYKNMQ